MTRRVRTARSADAPSLFALQGCLRDPSPELLAGALDGAGVVLVSTASDPRSGDRPGAIRPPAAKRPSPARATDRPVGYLLAVPGGDEVHVAEIAVDPRFRREGRARELLSAVDDRFEGATTLAVAPDNRVARRCYDALGFRVRERDPEYFDGDPALIMERRGPPEPS